MVEIPCPTVTFIQCPKCNRKLFKMSFFDKLFVEIKCQKCKHIVIISTENGDITLKTKLK